MHCRLHKAVGLVLVGFITTAFTATIATINNTTGTSMNMECVEIIYQGSLQDSFDAPISGEVTMDIEKTYNRIFMLRRHGAVDDWVLDAQNAGALAVFIISPTFYVGGYMKYRFVDKSNIANISIPFFEFGLKDGELLRDMYEQNEIQNITFVPKDSINPWDSSFNNVGYFLWTALLGVYSFVNIALIIWKMKLFIGYYQGFRMSMPLFILMIELVSNIIRIVSTVDIVCGNWIYPELVCVALSEMSVPFGISSFMLISLFWHEMMTSATVVVHPFIVKMRIPFFVGAGLLLALQLLRIFLKSFTNLDGLGVIAAVMYLVFSIGLITLYLVTGIKLLRRLKKSKHLGRAVKLRKTTIKILVSAGFLFLFFLIAAFWTSGLAYYPIRYMIVWYATFTFLNSTSLMNILAFELPASASTKSTGTSGNSGSVQTPRSSSTAILNTNPVAL